MSGGCTAEAARPPQQQPRAEGRADLQSCGAHRGPDHQTVAHSVGRHQFHHSHMASRPSQVLPAYAGRVRDGGPEWHRCSSNFIRPPPHAYSDTGFELARADLVLRPEMQPSGPHLQRITRSSRSRPSLHGSA